MPRATNFTELQPRQKLYIEGRSKGLSRNQALDYAGYSPNTRSTAVETPSVKVAFSRLVRRAAPAHKLAAVIAEGLEAKETKFFQTEGMVTDQRDVIAWSERRQYAQLAAEYGGYVESEAVSPEVSVGVKVIVEHIGRTQSQVTAETK